MQSTYPEYDQIRAISKDLNSKLFKALSGSEMRIAARPFGLIKKNKLNMESYVEMEQYADYAINDHFDQNGKNVVIRYLQNPTYEKTNIEKIILKSLLSSKSSLFEIIESDYQNSTIKIKDLFSGSEFLITDRSFSASPNACDYLMFSRILAFEEFNMTSGAPMIYHKEMKEIILSKYKRIMKKIPLAKDRSKLYVTFFKLYKKCGHENIKNTGARA